MRGHIHGGIDTDKHTPRVTYTRRDIRSGDIHTEENSHEGTYTQRYLLIEEHIRGRFLIMLVLGTCLWRLKGKIVWLNDHQIEGIFGRVGENGRKEGEKAVWLIISKQILSGQNCFFCFFFSPPKPAL